MAYRYFLEGYSSNKVYAHVEIPSLGANETITIFAKKRSGYAPTTDFLVFHDHFDGSALDTNKWDSSNATGDWSISDSRLNMWNNWGGYCAAQDYYRGIQTTQTSDLPLLMFYKGELQDRRDTSGCGGTGPTIVYGDGNSNGTYEVITSTDTNNQQGINIRVNDTAYKGTDIDAVPDEYRMIIHMRTTGLTVYPDWEHVIEINDTPNATTRRVVISGDSDNATQIDKIDYIFWYKSVNVLPSVTTSIVDSETLQIDITNNDSVDLTNVIVNFDITNFTTNPGESLLISDFKFKLLFENLDDNKIYSWDGSQWYLVANSVSDLTTSHFTNDGVDSPFNISKADLQSLTTGSIKAHSYIDDSNITDSVTSVNGIPYDQMLYSNSLSMASYSNIRTISVNDDGGSNNDVYTLVSNNGSDWYKHDGTSFVLVTSSLTQTDIVNGGWVSTDVSAVPSADWNDFILNTSKRVYFAFSFTENSLSAIKTINNIIATVDIDESWEQGDYLDVTLYENSYKLTAKEDGVFRVSIIKRFLEE